MNKRFSKMVPLKCLSNFWRTVEMPLINFEIKVFFNLVWKMYYSNRRLWQSRTKICNKWYKTLYVLVVALSAQGNEKLLQQSKIGLKRQLTGKYQLKPTVQTQNRYLNHLIDPSFHWVIDSFFYHLKMMQIEEVTSNNFFRL